MSAIHSNQSQISNNSFPQDLDITLESFNDSIGSLSTTEIALPLEFLTRRINETIKLKKILDESSIIKRNQEKPESSFLIFFDRYNIPKLENTDLYFLKNPEKKYSFYIGEHLTSIHTKVQALMESNSIIMNELLQNPIQSDTPLQEIRNRYIRFIHVIKENEALNTIDKYSRKNYDAGYNFSYADRFYFYTCSYFKTLPNTLLLPMLYVSTNQRKDYLHVFSEQEVLINNEIIPVEICAKFSFTGDLNQTSSISFHIRDKNSQEFLGSAMISRVWDNENETVPYDSLESMDNCELKNRRLQLRYLDENVFQDTSGNYPIRRLFLHMAVEILLRENDDTKLEVITEGDFDEYVCVSGGFYLENETTTSINEEIKAARESGHLFPHSECLCEKSFILRKSSDLIHYGSGKSTKFIRYENNQKLPAFVSFSLDSHTTTWEKLIKDQSLLGKGKKAILPKFWNQNLSLLEKK